MFVYLAILDVIALHEAVMRKLGFAPVPLRDRGALESATMRPRMTALYEQADLVRQAALLAVGISQAQAFLDGNKRAAFAALDTFLRLNSMMYGGDPIALSRQLELVAERSDSLNVATERFETWLRGEVANLE